MKGKKLYTEEADSGFGNTEQPEFIKSKSYSTTQDSLTNSELDNFIEKIDWEKQSSKKIKHRPQTSVFDVAAYIVQKMGTLSTMKLQKLVYYAQAWSLVWDEQPLFNEPIEAWANGPVVRDLFYFHRGRFSVSSIPIGNPDLLNENQKETIDAVLDFYGDKPAQWLIDLSHQEQPWQKTRKNLAPSVPSNRIIPLDLIAEYYSSL